MKTVWVKTKTARYPVLIGGGIAGKLPAELRKTGIKEKLLIASSPRIFALHGKALLKALKTGGFTGTETVLFDDSEKNKNWAACEKILKKLFAFEGSSMKKPALIAFGGGVIGDISGFAASIYKRGIPFINIPTTLLSMTDSAIGGKTGVDFPVSGDIVKNMLGTFYQPRLVVSDTDFLKTLPAAEIRNGIAEVIKYGIIRDGKLFNFLENNAVGILSLKDRDISHIIERSSAIKASVVGEDERETKGVRFLLNLGHTVGHALESASGFKYPHGIAVSIGIACACEISVKLGLMKKNELERVESLLDCFGLPAVFSGIGPEIIMKILHYDKKFEGGKNRFVLPVSIGRAVVRENVDWGIIKLTLFRHKMYNLKP